MKRFVGTLASIALVFGLGAITIPNMVNQETIRTPLQVNANTQYCQVCTWVWSAKAQKYVQSCRLVVCHAV